MILESGTHTSWVRRLLESLGHQVITANPSKVKLIAASRRKTDERDARCLAQLGRVDPELLSPVHARGIEAQQALSVVRAREGLVKVRTMLINQVRGTVKSFGARLSGGSATWCGLGPAGDTHFYVVQYIDDRGLDCLLADVRRRLRNYPGQSPRHCALRSDRRKPPRPNRLRCRRTEASAK